MPWFESERADAGGRGIAELLERAVAQRGYERYVLGLDWAERRLANVHKLLRLARRFEEQEGRELRAFVDLVAHLKDSGASEPEAPVEGVEPDTVQLMTIHTAKGLEFPVVCVADLGRRPPNPADRLFVDGERVGLRLRRPGEGESEKTLDYDELRAEQRDREREEEDRVFYVGLTRARERLLLSGVVDFADWPQAKSGTPPINWLGPALCRRLDEIARASSGVIAVPAEGGAPELRLTLSAPAGYGSVLQPPRAPAAAAATAGAGETAPDRPREPASASEERVFRPQLPPTLSYTSLSLLERCGYRYYLERVLRMPEEQRAEGPAPSRRPARAGARDPRAPGARDVRLHGPGLPAAGGSRPRPPSWASAPARAELDEVAALIRGALASPLAERIAASPQVRREQPFAFGIGPHAPLVTGVIDALCLEQDGTALVVDYKSDRLADGGSVRGRRAARLRRPAPALRARDAARGGTRRGGGALVPRTAARAGAGALHGRRARGARGRARRAAGRRLGATRSRSAASHTGPCVSLVPGAAGCARGARRRRCARSRPQRPTERPEAGRDGEKIRPRRLFRGGPR